MLGEAAAAAPELRPQTAAAKAEAAEALHDLTELLAAAAGQNPEVVAAARGGELPRPPRRAPTSAPAAWARLDAWHGAVLPFQSAALDRWQRKTLVSGGVLPRRGRGKCIRSDPSHLKKSRETCFTGWPTFPSACMHAQCSADARVCSFARMTLTGARTCMSCLDHRHAPRLETPPGLCATSPWPATRTPPLPRHAMQAASRC